MERSDWLLLFVCLGSEGKGPLDPIRIMKGLFLSSEDGVDLGYKFEPYHYGPCSFDVYKDLDSLVAQGLIEEVPIRGQTWNLYTPTSSGMNRSKKLQVSSSDIEKLTQQKTQVTSLSFLDLLKFVYDKYPRFAKNSVFRSQA